MRPKMGPRWTRRAEMPDKNSRAGFLESRPLVAETICSPDGREFEQLSGRPQWRPALPHRLN